jgi:hypothetical protein
MQLNMLQEIDEIAGEIKCRINFDSYRYHCVTSDIIPT